MYVKSVTSLLSIGAMSLTVLSASAMGTSGDWMMQDESKMMKKDTMMQDDSMMMKKDMMMKKSGVMVGGALMVPNLNIVENAMNARNVTTVVAAVKAAGLVDTLSGTGPFTVFAPTNAAFMRLPAGTVETLLKPENKAMLTGILTYHVVAGSFKISDLTNGMMLKTVNGQELKVTKRGRNVWINNARIQTRNVISSNGVTHVINAVLLPK